MHASAAGEREELERQVTEVVDRAVDAGATEFAPKGLATEDGEHLEDQHVGCSELTVASLGARYYGATMMVRTQVVLDADAHRRAKRRAADLGISFAEYVRRVLDHDLGDRPTTADPGRLVGLFDSGGSDVAREKDRYVDGAVAGRRRPG